MSSSSVRPGPASSPNHTTGPRGRQRAAGWRWLLLVLGLMLLGVGGFWVFSPLLIELEWDAPRASFLGTWLIGTPAGHVTGDSDSMSRGQFAGIGAGYLGLVLLTQYLFLLPRGSWRLKLSASGRPMFLAALGAGFAAMMLTIGLIATLMTFGGWWRDHIANDANFAPVWIAMAIVWVAWTIGLLLYWRGMDRPTAIARTLRWLIGGTILETLVAGPVHVWITREADCYCARGSYTGLVFGLTIAVWVFGPGVFLLFMREHQRRKELATHESQ